MTKFRALRSFLRWPGCDVVAGEVLELDDAEAALLVNLDAVEPIEASDRARVVRTDRVAWEVALEPREQRRLHRVA